MKKYISPRIEEIKMTADVIATSFEGTHESQGYGTPGGFAPGRRNRDYDSDYDLY